MKSVCISNTVLVWEAPLDEVHGVLDLDLFEMDILLNFFNQEWFCLCFAQLQLVVFHPLRNIMCKSLGSKFPSVPAVILGLLEH